MCLHVLWNILSHPTKIKYREISDSALFKSLEKRCSHQGIDINRTYAKMKSQLEEFGFEKKADTNWYYTSAVEILHLWQFYCKWIHTQKMYFIYLFIYLSGYQIKQSIPETVCMLKDNKWKEYEMMFDYENRRIVLLDKRSEKPKIETLQVGNAKAKLEFDVHIEWSNEFSKVDDTYTHVKWCRLVLNRSWHFRVLNCEERENLSNYCSEFNSFHVSWKDRYMKTHKEPVDPFSATLRNGLQTLEYKLRTKEYFLNGKDEVIWSKCKFENCQPPIPSTTGDDVVLHNVYKELSEYPHIQVSWDIDYDCMVSYGYTLDVNVPQSDDHEDGATSFGNKVQFNPLLYECDIQRFELVQSQMALRQTTNNGLKTLLHEMIKNGHLNDLLNEDTKLKEEDQEKIKKDIQYDKQNADQLILDDTILTILKEVKQLYHCHTHKQMGYPLQLHHVCAILLYCAKECNFAFSYDQIQFRHYKWLYFDSYLCEAIKICSLHERREESRIDLYCGLKEVRLESIHKEIKTGYFISYVSTSDDLEIAKAFQGEQGCILHFHPSMRRAPHIFCCDVSWISPFKHEREILFSRSSTDSITHKDTQDRSLSSWNAVIEAEDNNTQVILLTWAEYDRFLQQVFQINSTWGRAFNLNIIYLIFTIFGSDIENAVALLSFFKEWSAQSTNTQMYKEKRGEFMKKRCCDDNVNLFCYFLLEENFLPKNQDWTSIQFATKFTVNNGLPFVNNPRITSKQYQNYSKKLNKKYLDSVRTNDSIFNFRKGEKEKKIEIR
ncbi:hypothetical protein RFI_14130 [Reticulomyxa filosa]|uniref:Uncharacterized protein n=1 Tax=Reticulomyxa filosa TaxID=46433 RepID=X6NAW3_RETFI|nr:hypothetical protein RFI_14130 [Reticulomyxa filosa]|eukprot:ETO23053.1 hypothetical protein RFI_14130 [Reticulomyxa filosa]